MAVMIDQYSFASIPLQLRCNQQAISTATGFFHRRGENLFLVSNWHVFSGKHPRTGQPMNRDGAIPDEVVFPMHLKDKLGHFRKEVRGSLLNEDGNPLWLQHAQGQDIDVAVWQVPPLSDDLVAYEAIQPDEKANLLVGVGMDVFVVGFPRCRASCQFGSEAPSLANQIFRSKVCRGF